MCRQCSAVSSIGGAQDKRASSGSNQLTVVYFYIFHTFGGSGGWIVYYE